MYRLVLVSFFGLVAALSISTVKENEPAQNRMSCIEYQESGSWQSTCDSLPKGWR